MKAVIQRVKESSVTVDGTVTGAISRGWLVLLGVAPQDQESDSDYLADRILHLRAFPDQEGKMNLSVTDIGGEILVVSQFTLLGDCRKGRRPGFSGAAPPDMAKRLYEGMLEKCKGTGLKVASGIFGADMQVALVNDGPVTFILESVRD